MAKRRATLSDLEDRDTCTVVEAGEVFGVGRRVAYEAARRYLETGGREGLPVLRLGTKRLVVPVARLRALLGETNGNGDGRLLKDANGSRDGEPNGSG